VVRSIPSPFSPARAIAFDPATRDFFVADYGTMIKEIDSTGNLVQNISNSGLTITGLAWDPTDSAGYKLYAFSLDGAAAQTRVTRIHPVSHLSQTAADLPGAADDRAAGCTITPGWNSVLLAFAGVIHNDNGARIQMHEMEFNTTWISVNPPASIVAGGGSQVVTVHFDPSILRPDDYQVDLHIRSVVYDTTLILPVRLTRATGVFENQAGQLPERYDLHQNYPNPFNPVTQIRYDLKNAGLTRLAVYNLLGERVTDLVNAVQEAGTHEIAFDASKLGSGVYFYRLESGSFTQVRKMVLMK
jgi:hypothetical protein